jgi:hypothetical protein
MAREPAPGLVTGQVCGRLRAGPMTGAGTIGYGFLVFPEQQSVRRSIMTVTGREEAEPPEVELEVDPSVVCFIIAKARAFDAKVGSADRDEVAQPGEDEDHDILEDFGDDPVAAEIREAIEDLNEDQQIELVALTWLGRGDFSAEEWAEAIEEAAERSGGPTADYLLGQPMLGDLLEEGFVALGYSCEDYDVPV